MTETTLFHHSDIELLRGQRRTLLFERAQFLQWKDRDKIYESDKKLRSLNKQLFELTNDIIYK